MFDPVTVSLSKKHGCSNSGNQNGGGGLPVVELTTVIPLGYETTALTAEEQAAMDMVGASPFVLMANVGSDEAYSRVAVIANCQTMQNIEDNPLGSENVYSAVWWMDVLYIIIIINIGDGWIASVIEANQGES